MAKRVSVPLSEHEQNIAEARADELGLKRSQFYAYCIRHYLAHCLGDDVKPIQITGQTRLPFEND